MTAMLRVGSLMALDTCSVWVIVIGQCMGHALSISHQLVNLRLSGLKYSPTVVLVSMSRPVSSTLNCCSQYYWS